ncbi:FAD-dependent monooxygenase [Archangium violaceum]|uniref:FAD-dependent oxidoreductase n=1 Tax=Archangium violaceum TaxID=83451 RepID=UPI00195205B7|nr:NAD(P)/FAD-dependent oxidoreductase [Archangium violaceum]QRN96259.1 FAD-dependent monooxygenase [Archangium violaceum]
MSRAVVIGGGIAGLSAATVLSRHFERVLLVDKDGQDVQHARRGVPQVDHVHVLLRRGWMALGELFPGIDDDLTRAGAAWLDWGPGCYWVGRFGAFPRPPSEITSRSCSRGLLEKTVRARVASNPRIELVERFEAGTFRWDSSRRRILAVKAGDGRELEASLFVDASGRNGPFRSQAVLEKVDARASYSTCVVRVPHAERLPFRQIYVQVCPPRFLRGGGLVPIENGLFLALLVGSGNELPPGDREGFLDYARSLRDPALAQVLPDAEFLGPIHCFRRMAGTRVLSSSLQADNLVMLGDALCAFNPVYGQGMTVGMLSALELGRQLARDGRTSQKAFNELVEGPWLSAASEDLRVPGCSLENVSATRRLAMSLSSLLVDRVTLRATYDPDAHQRMMRVLHMVDPPTALVPLALPLVG